MKRTARYYWLTVIAYSNLTVGLAVILLFAGTVKQSIPVMVLGSCICAFSNGTGVTTTLIGLCMFPSLFSPRILSAYKANTPTVANASHPDQAVATACSYLFRSLGSVFGVSMCATAFNQTLRRSLHAALDGDKDAAEIAERVREGLSYFRSLDPQLKEVVKECYGEATRAALMVGVVLVAGSAVFAWFIQEKSLEDKKGVEGREREVQE